MTTTEIHQTGRRPVLTGAGLSVLVALAALAALFLATSTALASAVPGAPAGLVVAPGNGKLVAGWNAPEGGASVTSYTVQYKTSTAVDWQTAGHAGAGTDTEIAGLTNAVTYDVRVRASNGAGHGQWSAAVSANPHKDVVWSAVLTVDDHVNGQYWGCTIHPVDESGDWMVPCSEAMTEDEFTHEGDALRFTEFVYIANWDYYNVLMVPSVSNNSGLRKGELRVGSDTYALDDASLVEWYDSDGGFNIGLPNAVSWSKGQKVPLSLGGGPPKAEPTVAAQDQVASSDATLSALSVSDGSNDVPLTPAFAAGAAGYTASVDNSVSSVTVTPTVNDPSATVTVEGSAVASGTASAAVALTAGVAETIDVVVTAQNGDTRTYTVTVTRQKSSDATLSALTVSDGTNDVSLTPAFAADTTGYTAGVPNSVGSVTVTPTVNDPSATVTVEGSAVTSGTASAAVALTAGVAETIDVVVTAQSGDTRTYTVTVTREAAAQSPQVQASGDRDIIEQCRRHTGGVEGLRVCVTPSEGADAILLLTLSHPAPANGTTVTLAVDPDQTASDDDYTMPSSIIIPQGERNGLITIAITADDEDEGNESIYIYACIRDGCDPLNPIDGEKTYNHGIVIPGTRVGGV